MKPGEDLFIDYGLAVDGGITDDIRAPVCVRVSLRRRKLPSINGEKRTEKSLTYLDSDGSIAKAISPLITYRSHLV
jgi:hypothetical protein